LSSAGPTATPDDPVGVPNGSRVYRRIPPVWWIPDDDGGKRLTSAAFQDKDGYLSIGVGQVLDELGLAVDDILIGFEGYGLAGLEVAWIRNLHLGVTREPTEDEPWHGAIWGSKTGSVKRKMSEEASVLIEPSTPA